MLDYELDDDDIHVGPSDHVPWLQDRKWCYIRMEGTTFGDVPLNAELKLEVWDSPNSAGVITDAIRCLKLGLDRGLAGHARRAVELLHEEPADPDPRRHRVQPRRGVHPGRRQRDAGRHRSRRRSATLRKLAGSPGSRAKAAAARRRTRSARVRLEAPHRRPARGSRLVEKLAVVGWRAAHGWLVAACRPGARPVRSLGHGAQLSYLLVADQAALVERELRPRPGPAAGASRGAPPGPRAPTGTYGRYLVELMRLPRLPRRRAAPGCSSPHALDEIEPIWRGLEGGLILSRRPRRQQRGRRGGVASTRAGRSRGRRRLVVSRAVRAARAAARGRGASRSSRGATCARCTRVLRRARDAGAARRLGLPARRHPVRLFDAWTTLPAGPATLAAKTGREILPVAIRRQPGRPLPRRPSTSRSTWRRPTRPTSSGRRRRSPTRSRDRRRGARAVVQLQADVARDRGRKRPSLRATGRRCSARRPSHRRRRPRRPRRPRGRRDGDGRRDRPEACRRHARASALRGSRRRGRLVARLPAARGVRSCRLADLGGDVWYRAQPGARGPGAAEPAPRRCLARCRAASGSEPARARRDRPARPRAARPGRVPPPRPLLPRGGPAPPAMTRSSCDERLLIETPGGSSRTPSPGRAADLRRASTSGRSSCRPCISPFAPAATPRSRWRRSTTRSSSAGSSGRGARSASGSSAFARRGASSSRRSDRGEPVGLVGDRDLTGGGHAGRRCSARRRRCRSGRRCSRSSSGSPVYVAAVRRAGRGRYRGELDARSRSPPRARAASG